MSHPPLHGLDLVTDATEDFVDPEVHRIVAVGLSTAAGEEIYRGDETELLPLLDRRIALLPPGVLVTWQGSLLDLPLLAACAERCGVELGLRLRADHRRSPASIVVGVDHPWCADWHEQQHLELRRIYEDDGSGRRWNPLRPSPDPESFIPPSHDLVRRDPRKDAKLARCLAERRWERARPIVDRMPPRIGTGPGAGVDVGGLVDPVAHPSSVRHRRS